MSTIIEIVNSILELFIVIFFFNQMLRLRQVKKIVYWGTVSSVLVIHILLSFFYIHTYLNIGLTILLWSLLLLILYNDSLAKKFLAICIYILIILANDILSRFISSLILGIDYTLSSSTDMQRYIVMAISDCLCFVMLSYIAMIAKRRNSTITLKYWLMMLLFPIFSLFIVICLDIFILSIQSDSLEYIFLLLGIIVGLLYFNIVVFEFIDTYSAKLQLAAAKELINKQAANYHLLEINEKELHFLKHNIQNHMKVMQTMLNNNSISEPQNFMNSLNKLSTLPLGTIYTNDITLDSILNSEEKKAFELDIKYIVKTHRMHCPLNIDPADKSTILCNAIDNAIEACEHVDDRFILIDIASDENKITINIENSSLPIAKHGNLILSTKTNSKNHGFGIMSIKYVLNRYNGKFNLSYNNGISKCTILLDNFCK